MWTATDKQSAAVCHKDGGHTSWRATGMQFAVLRDGKFRTSNVVGQNAQYTDPVYVCPNLIDEMVEADYLLFWARRLLDIAGACHDPWYGFMAVCAARAAAVRLVDVSATCLHELGHEHVLGHCRGGGAPSECCHILMEEDYRQRMLARHGLPDYRPIAALGGFYEDEWPDEELGYAECKGLSLHTSRHCGLFFLNRTVTTNAVRWGKCAAGGRFNSTLVTEGSTICSTQE